MNIYEKMLAITQELTAVKKNLDVGVGKSSYKAVGEADVLAAVRPLEAKHGVYSYPFSREIVSEWTTTKKSEYNGKVTEATTNCMRLRTVYRFVNTESPEEYIEITSYSDGVDTGDKAPGKAMTYGDKYALLKAYKIITGEDPDQYISPETSEEKPKPPEWGSDCRCEECGKEIESIPDKKGRMMSSKSVMDLSIKRYGRALCKECREKIDADKQRKD